MKCLVRPPARVGRRSRWCGYAVLGIVMGCLVLSVRAEQTDRSARLSADPVLLLDWTSDMCEPAEEVLYEPLAHRDDTWYGSTYWTGPDWTRVGRDWHHSGERTSSIRRFAVPRDGRMTITGRVCKADTGGGDGVRVEIRIGQRSVWHAEIDAQDTVGVDPVLDVDVRQGDSIRFIVHRRGTIGYDTTHWDPRIAYEGGEVFQASSGFSAQQPGQYGWQYEMETDADGPRPSPWPVVRGIRPQLLWYEFACSPAQSVDIRTDDALPAWVISRGADDGGVVIWSPTSAACRLHCTLSDEGRLRVQLIMESAAATGMHVPESGDSLPPHLLAPYEGTWLDGVRRLQQLLTQQTTSPDLTPLGELFATAAHRAGIVNNVGELPELDLCAMVQGDWIRQDGIQDEISCYAVACQKQLARAQELLAALQRKRPEQFLPFARQLADQVTRTQAAESEASSLDVWRWLYQQTRWLKRHIALSNPLMEFGPLMFCKRVPTSYSHLVMQYFGWRARAGGGIFVLERPGYSLSCRDVFDGRLEHGNVLEPRLSYDGTRVAFSFVACDEHQGSWDPAQLDNLVDQGFYHIWTGHLDGSDLRQLTAGPYDDLMPSWLPDGGFAFSSTRRRGYARCFGGQFSPRWHVYTIHRMNGDGTDIRLLSAHDTNEWFPVVSNSGHILYSRWDYIDRDAVTHQNLWAMRPDGTNPVAVWGNATSSPHCAFQAQPIPHSGKIVFTASAHHSITGGSLVLLDPRPGVDGHAGVTRLTPEIPFPEAESMDIREYYAAPWPLSEDFYLAAYSPVPLVWEPGANGHNALGIYLLDRFGNRELLYRDPAIGSTNPCPLVPRPVPPVISDSRDDAMADVGEFTLMDVYEGLGDVPRGSIQQLRIVQIFPKTTPVAEAPPVGLAREENARAILGTVPVEPDGSARFLVPAMKPVLFQALDEQGFAYQTMRTITYVQPGERVGCIGCHESRATTPSDRPAAALLRPASVIEPGSLGGRPFSFMEVVQPVLDKHCVRCHGPERPDGDLDLSATPHNGFSQSYWSLCGDRDFWGAGTNPENAAAAWVPRFGARNQIQVTPPGGSYGARGSRLIKLLQDGHEDVDLTADDLERLAAWIDCNAIFFGVNHPDQQARQLRGEVVAMPDIQ